MDELLVVIERALEGLRLRQESTALLGISVRKIQYRLQQYRGIGAADFEPPSTARRTAFRIVR